MGLIKDPQPQSYYTYFVKKFVRGTYQFSSLGKMVQGGFCVPAVLRNSCQTQYGVQIVFLRAEREQIILFSLAGVALSQIGIAKQSLKYCGVWLRRFGCFNHAD